MFDQIIRSSYHRQKHLDAPFLEERVKYIQDWADRGGSLTTLQAAARGILKVVEFLPLESGKMITLEEVKEAANNLASYQYDHSKKKTDACEIARKRFIWYAIDWLKKLNWLECLPEEKIPLFNEIFKYRQTLQRHVDAPLLEERLIYLQHLADGGVKKDTLRRIAKYLLIIMDYLNFFKLRTISRHEIDISYGRWAKNKKIYRRKSDSSKFSKTRFIQHGSRWLDMLGCLEKPIKGPFPFEEYLTKYIQYMREERGFSEYTIKSRLYQLKNFLISLYGKKKTLIEVTPLIIDGLITENYSINQFSRTTIQAYILIIQLFLRYAQNQGWCQKNLADSIKAPSAYKNESLPSSPRWEDVKQLLAMSKTDRPIDIRDYAILMLLSIYGLRCSEVKSLRLEDIDWNNEIIYIKRAKKSKPQIFPLSQPVGEAILNYLKKVRPNHCSLRELFLCMISPYRPLGSRCIYEIVSKKLRSLDLKIKHYGPHALRHGCATHLINQGISLKEISDYLGHQELDTTQIYAKVDLTNLRKVAVEFILGDLL